jgi:hypothetical protein
MIEVHVCRGTNRRYLARIRRRGERRWTVLGKPRLTYKAAVRAMSEAFASESHWFHGDVALVSDWYEPHSLVEMKRT